MFGLEIMENHVDNEINSFLSENTLKKLQHPLRQQILKAIEINGELGYKKIETILKIPSGTLYYHLKLLEGLIKQNLKSNYILTADGMQALNYYYSVLDSSEGKDNKKSSEDNFHQLSHSMRRKILITIEQEGNFGIGYKDLLTELNLTSGTLYYHLKFLKGIIKQNEDKKYILTSSGVQTLNYFFQHIQTSGISISRAMKLLQKGNYADIIQNVSPSTTNLDATYILIDAYINTVQIAKAESLIKDVLSQVDSLENQLYKTLFSAKCLIASNKILEAEKTTLAGIELFKNISSKRKRFQDLYNNFQLILGECFWRQHKIAEGLDLLEKLFNKLSNSDQQLKGLIHDNIAGIYWVKGDENTALDYAKSALKYFQSLENPSLIEIVTVKIETWIALKKKVSDDEEHFKQLMKKTLDDFEI